MKKRDVLFWSFAAIQGILIVYFSVGIINILVGVRQVVTEFTPRYSLFNELDIALWSGIILALSTIGIEYLIYSKK